MMDRENIRSVVAAGEEKLGPITTLVDNAGVSDANRATKMTDEAVDNLVDVNLKGPYILSCEIARRLMKKKTPRRDREHLLHSRI